MVVIIVESVPTQLRGLLTRWFIEPKAGVFVGSVSARVRELVWQEGVAKVRTGHAVLVRRSDNEQGFLVLTHGDSRREVVDIGGLQLVRFRS